MIRFRFAHRATASIVLTTTSVFALALIEACGGSTVVRESPDANGDLLSDAGHADGEGVPAPLDGGSDTSTTTGGKHDAGPETGVVMPIGVDAGPPMYVCNDPSALSEFPLATANSTPAGLAVGPDGNLWFAEPGNNAIGKITMKGAITEYSLGSTGVSPTWITAGPDGNLWFTATYGLGTITTAGVVTEHPFPTSDGGGHCPSSITSDGNVGVWFTDPCSNSVGTIRVVFTPDGGSVGEIVEYAVPPSLKGDLWSIAPGGNNDVWFTTGPMAVPDGGTVSALGHVASDGTMTSVAAPGMAFGIAAAPGGSFWIAGESTNADLFQFTPPSTFKTPGGGFFAASVAGLTTLAVDPGGNPWVVLPTGEAVGQESGGWYTTLPTPGAFATVGSDGGRTTAAVGIVSGPDGNVWFTEDLGNKIGRVNVAVCP